MSRLLWPPSPFWNGAGQNRLPASVPTNLERFLLFPSPAVKQERQTKDFKAKPTRCSEIPPKPKAVQEEGKKEKILPMPADLRKGSSAMP